MRFRNLAFAILLAAAALPALASTEVLPWVENDYTKAVARAKSEHVPIFAEAWAPW